jgi:hypothetical protein
MLPFFKIVVNENDDTGVDFNSFVDVPAHLKGFIAFNKDAVRYEFNDEKRIVTGVMISAGTPIYRNSKDLGEHYVVFDAKTIDIIRKKFFKQGFNGNVNKMHDMAQTVKGATLIDSYIVSNSDPKLPNIPEAFENQRLLDGSWIASYYVEDPILWDEVKSGKFNGFSVEGWFDKIQVNIKKKSKMQKDNKSIWDLVKDAFSSDEPKAEPKAKFAEATTAEGVVVFYDGELAEGTVLTVEVDGEMIPAPEGDHQLTLEDESVKIVTLDAAGVVTSISDFEPMANDDEPKGADEEMRAEVANAIAEAVKEVNDRFEKVEAENAELKAKLDAIAEGEKFKAEPKKNNEKKGSYKDLLKK